MSIPVKVFVYLDSNIFYCINNFSLLTACSKVKMLSDLFSLVTEYYFFSLICIQTDLVRSQPLNNKRKIMINVFIYFFIDLLIKRRFVSKCCIWLCLIDLRRSLINMINNSGPKTDPCGTPWEIGYGRELNLFTDVKWTLRVTYQWNQLLAWPVIS